MKAQSVTFAVSTIVNARLTRMSMSVRSSRLAARTAALRVTLLQGVLLLTWTLYALFLPQMAQRCGIPPGAVIWILVADQLKAGFRPGSTPRASSSKTVPEHRRCSRVVASLPSTTSRLSARSCAR
jgi:hypothetical protein